MLEWVNGNRAWIRGYSSHLSSYTPIDWEDAGETIALVGKYDIEFLKVLL